MSTVRNKMCIFNGGCRCNCYMFRVTWITIIYILYLRITTSEANNYIQDEFIKHIENYEITIPSRVTREGNHVSFSLNPGHSVRRRSAEYSYTADDNIFHYKVRVENQDILLEIKPNNKLTSPSLVIERKKNRFKNVTDSSFRKLDDSYSNCHFHGKIVNQSDSRVAVGVCNGLHGFLHTNNVEYFIEPLQGDPVSSEGHQKHVVYRRSALPLHLDPVRATHLHKRSTEDDSCGVKDTLKALNQRERWEQHHRERRKAPRRKKRSVSTERYVETFVVVDPKMVEYHASEHLETYVLTIMNMVATMFHDATVGNSINIVIVRILIMEEDDKELVITHHADNSLKSFCKFQKRVNFKNDDHPNHHDVAILLTRHNICSRVNEPCSTLGLAQVAGMCQPHRSCNINEDTGLALAYTVTHELGHNFGMHHDGYNNGCEDPPGKQLYIMSPSLVADSLRKSWSNCSKAAITKFIDRDWGYCLNDEPAEHLYKFPKLPAGTMYDANHQCRLQYGTDDTEICTDKEDVCSNLWCRINNRCSTHLEAAAEGTICGTNKWCYEGKCVKIGDRPESINGEWGQWSAWTDCTRTCGAGVSHSQRHCDNPQPSHGGKFCLGERKRYRICNTEDCPENSPSFNQVQCQGFNYIPYKKGLYEWEHVPTTEAPCQLHCKPQNQFFSVLLKDIVTDGTPCTPGTRNMCISGRCRHIGCDYMIDSKAIEDRCGICHGDGSTCKMIKKQYNETQGLGYVQAAVIPIGARNIRVEEVAAANNFLALQNDKGEYYLNGHWFIQWSGDYKIAGTTVRYEREGNMESVTAQGPLKEPLHVMLLLQSQNPGVTFEYTVPKENISESRVPEFNWSYQPWTHCTSSCGGGTQRSEVACTEIEAGIVEDKYCVGIPKPDDKQKVCNEHLCPARWWFGPWQHCSVTCGDKGIHQRTVICVRSLGPDEQIALDDEACSDQEKPKEIEPCHKKEPCAGTSPWILGDWSSCNENPCGLKYRSVLCDDPVIGCHQNEIPVSEMPCSNVTCGHWVAEDWVECTRSCGNGIQYRKVVCDGGIQCDPHKEPPSEQNCNLKPCPTHPPSTSPSAKAHIQTSSTATIKDNVTQSVGVPTLVEEHPVSSNPETANRGQNLEEKDNKFDSLGNQEGSVESVGTKEPKTENVDEKSENYIETSLADDDLNIEKVTEPLPEMNTLNNKAKEQSKTSGHGNIDEASESYVDKDQEVTDLEPTTSEAIKDIEINPSELEAQNMKSDVKTGNDANLNSDTENVSDDNKESDIETDTHKHRHHHAEQISVQEGTHLAERNPSEDKVKVDSVGSETQLNIANTDTALEKSNNPTISGSSTNNNSSQIDHTNATNTDTPVSQSNSKMPETKLDSFDVDKLPPLPPLPDISKLPPLPNKSLPPLPDVDKLPPLPNKDLHLPPLPDIDNLPHVSDKDLPPLPDKDKLSPLPDENIPPLPSLDKIPQFPNTQKGPSLPDSKTMPSLDSLPPLPNPEDFSVFKDKDLPPLPDKDKLAPLPDLDHLPPVPDLPHLPDLDKLSPLPESRKIATDIEKKTDSKNIEVILNSNIDIHSEQPIDNRLHLSDSDNVLLTEDSFNDHADTRSDLSAIQDMDHSESLTPWTTDTKEKNYTWVSSDWSECSRYCGRGVRTRSVVCQDLETVTQEEEINCDINVKPNPTSECNTQPCLEWVTSDWGRCSASCGDSVKTRIVYCPRELSCDEKSKPVERQKCVVPKCVKWVSGQWSRCTKTCGGGEQFRLIQCVNTTSQQFAVGCDITKKPEEKQDCNTADCPEQKAAALTVGCEHNEMSSVVCRALRRMQQCNNRFVAMKCCKTCGSKHHNKHRPKGSALR